VLQQQRQHHGYTQSELAERANLSLKYLGEVERGEANVTVDALERIAAALEWDPWELFNNERTPISQSVHQLLIAELTGARQRLQTVIDWLLALDPATRPNVPAALDQRKPGEAGATVPPLVAAAAAHRQGRRRALPKRAR
jgi:transcriptional regulator with XRE-family HTH domain